MIPSRWRATAALVTTVVLVYPCSLFARAPHASGFAPGERVLLDAHNAYPERGRFAGRIDDALATGLPVAIEQDLYWVRNAATGRFEAVVAHDVARAATLQRYAVVKKAA